MLNATKLNPINWKPINRFWYYRSLFSIITNFSMPNEKAKAALNEKKRMQAVKEANIDSVMKKDRA
jgi:hypothetical protein